MAAVREHIWIAISTAAPRYCRCVCVGCPSPGLPYVKEHLMLDAGSIRRCGPSSTMRPSWGARMGQPWCSRGCVVKSVDGWLSVAGPSGIGGAPAWPVYVVITGGGAHDGSGRGRSCGEGAVAGRGCLDRREVLPD